MIWRVNLTDSKGSRAGLVLENEWGGQNGTWRTLTPGAFQVSDGTFLSRTWGADLMGSDFKGRPVLVVRLYNFWYISGIWANDGGTAEISQGHSLNTDDKARWSA